MRERLAQDPHRPGYHFLPPANWMNDPNGLIQWQGQYHLFYQYNPEGPFFGKMHWGHAVSEDLVYWTDLPIALAPTPGTADEDGCWSGCTVNDNGTPTIIYTGFQGGKQLPCVAMSAGDLVTWEKYPGNPVVPSPPSDLEIVGFRDHAVWRERDTWYQIIGSGINGVGGTAFLYRSPDLIHWDYMHPIYVGESSETGEMWECPDLFPLGDEHVLVLSPMPLRKAIYLVGTYADHKFTPETEGVLDYGGHFYAAQTMLDDKGRRLMWGWLWEGRSDRSQREAGWAGVMSLPWVLSSRRDGLLGLALAPELQTLRKDLFRLTDVPIATGSLNVLPDVKGDALEILAEFELGDADAVGVKVRCSPDGVEQTLVIYDRMSQRLEIDRECASLDPEVQRDRRGGPLQLDNGETLKLHIFLDRSVVEVFGNNRVCVTSRIYPSRPDSLGIDVFTHTSDASLVGLDVWQMGSIWPKVG
jgi:beta-fructofuranosidase